MSRDGSPDSVTYEYHSNNCSPYRRTLPEHDMISQLRVQVFERDQNRRNYNNLLTKFHNLETELAKITELKNLVAYIT